MTALPRLIASTVLASGLSFSAHAAAATPLTAYETLQQFNLITFGDARSNSHVDGRAYIGGNLNGGDFAQHAGRMPASDYAGLTVGGDAVGRISVNGGGIYVNGDLSSANINAGSGYVGGNATGVNFNGLTYVGGTASGSNFNGGRSTTAPSQPSTASFESDLRSFSQVLSGLSDTGSTVSISGNKASFTAVAGSDGVAVFDLTALDTQLFSLSEFSFNLNGASLIVFNVDDSVLNFSVNFLGGSAQTLGSHAIWNFYNATSLTINNQFGGTVLAPYAALTNNQNIEGTVVANTLFQNGEIHLQTLVNAPTGFGVTTPVPEPETYAMLLAGLGVLGLAARRRKQTAAAALAAA